MVRSARNSVSSREGCEEGSLEWRAPLAQRSWHRIAHRIRTGKTIFRVARNFGKSREILRRALYHSSLRARIGRISARKRCRGVAENSGPASGGERHPQADLRIASNKIAFRNRPAPPGHRSEERRVGKEGR